MQKNNKSFIRALLKFLKSKVDTKPTYEGITLLGIDDDEPKNGFKIKFGENEYILRLYDSHYNNEDASYLNLRDLNRPKGKNSLIQSSQLNVELGGPYPSPLLGQVYYFVDCGEGVSPDCLMNIGNDSNNGTSKTQPFKSSYNC